MVKDIRIWWQNRNSEEGQDVVEYALLLGLIALAAVLLLQQSGAQVAIIWGNIVTWLTTAAGIGGS